MPKLTVKALGQHPRRRAGFHFTQEPKTIEATDAEAAAILGDKMLQVTEGEPEAEPSRVGSLTAENIALKAQLDATAAERDGLKSQVAGLIGERQALKEQVAELQKAAKKAPKAKGEDEAAPAAPAK